MAEQQQKSLSVYTCTLTIWSLALMITCGSHLCSELLGAGPVLGGTGGGGETVAISGSWVNLKVWTVQWASALLQRDVQITNTTCSLYLPCVWCGIWLDINHIMCVTWRGLWRCNALGSFHYDVMHLECFVICIGGFFYFIFYVMYYIKTTCFFTMM